jgi:glycosyltransferase involved in cell wall biosynthesis
MTKASICIPTLCDTEERFAKLAECVASALAQTYSDLEVVVLDNASAIDVEGRLRALFPDVRLQVYRNARTLPMPCNFNEAIARSTGEVVKPLCDDDLLHPDLVRGCLDAVMRLGFLRIRDVRFRDRSEVRWSGRYVPKLAGSLSWIRKYRRVDAISPTCTIFHRQAWESLGRYATALDHAWDYVFAMEAQLRFGFHLSLVPGCAFRVWPGSCTARNRDPFRNFKELHVLYRRNRTPSLRLAKASYVAEVLARALAHPRRIPEVLRAARNYLR